MKITKSYPWIVVALLWVVALLNYMDRQMLSTMQEAMKADIAELNRAEAFGALMAVFLWIYGIVSPFAGIIADQVSRKWLVIGSLFVWSAVTFLMGYATTFRELYWLRAFMGISEALYIPSALSLIADWHEGKSRSLAVGIHMTGLYVGQAIGGFGATVAALFSWHSTFHWFGIVGILYSFVLLLTLNEKPKDHLSSDKKPQTSRPLSFNVFKGLGVVLSNWAFWIILFYFAAPSLPGWATKNWLPTLFSSSLNIPMADAGPLSTSAIGLGMTIPALLLLGLGHHIIAIVGAGLCFGVGYGIFDANNMPILCQFVSARYRATAYGVMNMTGVFAGAAVTQVLGAWSDGGNLGLGFALLGAVVALALALQLIFLRPTTDNMQ